MVAPAKHEGDLAALSSESAGALFSALQHSLRVLESALKPDGFNVGANLGRVAGAGIPDHVHLHVVPRWGGDTNFMPVLSEVKVVNEHLERTWEKLSQAFAAS
jgi:ATP adenylyltransferase